MKNKILSFISCDVAILFYLLFLAVLPVLGIFSCAIFPDNKETACDVIAVLLGVDIFLILGSLNICDND